MPSAQVFRDNMFTVRQVRRPPIPSFRFQPFVHELRTTSSDIEAFTEGAPLDADTLARGGSLDFHIEPQKQFDWCWASIGVGFSKFHQTPIIPAGQCQLASGVTGNACCPPGANSDRCNRPIGFDRVLNFLGLPFDENNARAGPITFGEIAVLILTKRPVCVQIAWPTGMGSHLVVVYAFQASGGENWVWVRDPLDGFSHSFSGEESRRIIPYSRLFSYAQDDSGPNGSWVFTFFPKKG
jgi:hypothetical protein